MSTVTHFIPAMFAAAALIPARMSVKARTFDDRAAARMLAATCLVGAVWASIVVRWRT